MTLQSFLTQSAVILTTSLIMTPLAAAQAVVTLSGASGGIVQTSDSAWSLTKTGEEDTSNSTVAWP